MILSTVFNEKFIIKIILFVEDIKKQQQNNKHSNYNNHFNSNS